MLIPKKITIYHILKLLLKTRGDTIKNKKLSLFENIEEETLHKIKKLNLYTKKTYQKNESISFEGDTCTSLGLIDYGQVEISKVYPSGNKLIINNFTRGDVFGESILFSNINSYPANVLATEDTSIYFIDKNQLIELFSISPNILNNFLAILSNRIVMLSERIELLSHSSIREKIASFLIAEYRLQKTDILSFNYTRKNMAEILNIPRPSLSRELNNMKEDKIIDYKKNQIEILDIKLLENIIIEGL